MTDTKINDLVDKICRLWADAGSANTGCAYDCTGTFRVQKAKEITIILKNRIAALEAENERLASELNKRDVEHLEAPSQ